MPITQEPLSSTARIDALRNPLTYDVIEQMKTRVNSICSMDTIEDLGKLVLHVFPGNKNKIIRDFFTANPVAWTDLLRKLHKLRKNDREQGWYIPDENISEIYDTFLIRGRKSDIGEGLRKLLPEVISKNQTLLEFASKKESLLDMGGYTYAQIGSQQRSKLTEKLINVALITNIDGCNYDSLEIHFKNVFPKILRYLKEIYGIDLPLGFCTDLKQLNKELEKMFNSRNGEQRENAFRIIQAFHAWSGIEKIERAHAEAEGYIGILSGQLEKLFNVKVLREGEEIRNGNRIYKGFMIYEGHRIGLEWRLKSIKSILNKLSETEEYTNMDAVRDMLGLSISCPDNIDESIKIRIATIIASWMPHYGYISRNRGGISHQGFTHMSQALDQKNKSSVYTTSSVNSTTTINMQNLSFSGFSRLGTQRPPIGFEVQIYEESGFKNKKEDDPKYKPRGGMLGLMRGPKFATPNQLYNLLVAQIDVNNLKLIGFPTLNLFIHDLIKQGFLIPYVDAKGETLLFTCKPKEGLFREKFPHMERVNMDHRYYQKSMSYIDKLSGSAMSYYDYQTTSSFSLPTQIQDRGGKIEV